MANDDQGACFFVIGIVIIVMTFVIWWSPFFLIVGVGFIIGGICLSQQKAKRVALTSQSTSSQPQSLIQQTATPVPVPPQPVQEPEKAKFCPHCGNPATENFCEACGAQID